MSAQQDEKTEKPTPRRRQDARKKGQVARSNDLTGAVGLLAGAWALPGFANWLALTSREATQRAATASPDNLQHYVTWWTGRGVGGVLPILLGMAAVSALSVACQVGIMGSGEALKPRWERLNPLQGIQRLLSRQAAFEGLKATVKFAVLGSVAATLLRGEWDRFQGLGGASPAVATAATLDSAQSLGIRFGLAWLAIGIVDYIFQRRQVERQIMMSRDELRREMREQEGSPELKSAQAQRRRKLAKGGMASKLKTADVIVTNPTHFAVAIAYDRSTMRAPEVIAKGQDYLALRMREMAADLKVPLVENRALARALYKRCEPGDPVPGDLFVPVAELLAYVYRTFRKVRGE